MGSTMDFNEDDVVVFFVDFNTREMYVTVNGKRSSYTFFSEGTSIPAMEKARKDAQKLHDAAAAKSRAAWKSKNN